MTGTLGRHLPWVLIGLIGAAALAIIATARGEPVGAIWIVAAADTIMHRPSRDLMAEHFPGVPIKGELAEHGTLLSIDKARRVLGYQPRHGWR